MLHVIGLILLGDQKLGPVTVVIRYCKVLCLHINFFTKQIKKKSLQTKIFIFLKCERIEQKTLKCTATPSIVFKSVLYTSLILFRFKIIRFLSYFINLIKFSFMGLECSV